MLEIAQTVNFFATAATATATTTVSTANNFATDTFAEVSYSCY